MAIESKNTGRALSSGPDGVNVATSPTEPLLRGQVKGDAFDRVQVLINGTILAGDGTVVPTPPSATNGAGLPSTVVNKTTTYTAAGGELVQADTTSAGFTVTLPTNPTTGTLVAVKKVDAGTNTVTIAPAGGGTIDGAATVTTSTPFAGAVFEHVGSNVWVIAASMSTTGPAGRDGTNGTNGLNGTPTTSWYGDGSDGTVTFDGISTIAGVAPVSNVYVITRNVWFNDCTINSGVTVITNAWVFNVKGTFTNNGTLHNNGLLGGAGAVATSGATRGTDGSGTGNVGGSAGVNSGFLGYGRAGGVATPAAGTSTSNALGGNGGAGGSASGGATAGGAAGTGGGGLGLNADIVRLAQWATIAYGLTATGLVQVQGGAGGGGAANDTVNQGGGGGGGGGVLVLNAFVVVNNGAITADGARGAHAAGGNSGGGGGGGGGALIINTSAYSGSGTRTANGGAGGNKAGTGANGSAGSAGTVRTNIWG